MHTKFTYTASVWFGVFCLSLGVGRASEQPPESSVPLFHRSSYSAYSAPLPVVAIKTNVLYWAATTPNFGVEVGLGRCITLEVSANYNPWNYGANRKLKHWLIQPELRVWLRERFNGHFMGVHGHYAAYNVGGIDRFGLKGLRYQGDLYGAGISYGYQWVIDRRWILEATIGVGYARLTYDKYAECDHCGRLMAHEKKHYFGPTKVGLTFLYVF